MSAFGERGGWWVVVQVVWMTVIGVLVVTGTGVAGPLATGVGIVLAVAGLTLSAAGGLALGTRLTSYPEPLPGQTLVERGVYARVRHPIYGGVVLSLVGVAVAFGEPVAAVLAAALGPFFWLKSMHEERRLSAIYPEYAEYRRRVPRRLIPWLL